MFALIIQSLAANLGVTTGKIENREWNIDEQLHEIDSFIVEVLNFCRKTPFRIM